MRIAVVGSGYVGLVAGTCLAENGHTVTCVDLDEDKIEGLKNGIIPIYEPGLEELIRRNVQHGRLSFTTKYEEAIPGVEAAFIAVGTPPGEDGSADLQYVIKAARSIAQNMTGYTVIVDKSTVPVGTGQMVHDAVEECTDHEFDVVSNPEFLKEGDAIADFMRPDRIVIGTNSERAFEVMDQIYHPFLRTGSPILHMELESAEVTKYASNAMLATRISFMNEVANLCMRVGANVDNVRRGMGTDKRIGSRFLFAGLGYGGSCFPKDVKALIRTSAKHDYDFRTLMAVEDVNERQKRLLYDMVSKHYDGQLAGKRFAIWGLSFKPNTDDMREAPSVVVIRALLDAGASVCAFDPEAMEECRKGHLGDSIDYADCPTKALEGADALILITEWNQFQGPDFDQIKDTLTDNVIFDGRNVYRREHVESRGLAYHCIGR